MPTSRTKKHLVLFAALLGMVACDTPGAMVVGVASSGQALGTSYNPVLGVGVNFAEDTTYTRCVNGEPIHERFGFQSRPYIEKRILTQSDLDTQLGISASLRAKSFWGSASASTDFLKHTTIEEDSFYWLVNARYEVGTDTIDTRSTTGFGLTPFAKQALEEEGLEGFYRACGTHFYISRLLGGQYSLLYEVHSRADRVVEQLNAQASYSGFGAVGSAAFKKFVDTATSKQTLTIHSNIVGGDSAIAEHPGDPEHLPQQLQLLRSQVEQPQRSAVLEWGIQSYDIFPEIRKAMRTEGQQTLSDQSRFSALQIYYKLYKVNEQRVARIERIMSQTEGEEPFLQFSANKMAAMNVTLKAHREHNRSLSRLAQQCLSGAQDCSLEATEPLGFDLPAPDADHRSLGEWKIYAAPRAHSKVMMDLVGKPPQGRRHTFYTDDKLIETVAAYVRVKPQDDYRGDDFVDIGSFSQAVDPATGHMRIAMCLGDFAKVCNLRVIEHPTIRMADGTPAAKLQLTVFDDIGFVREELDFLMVD